LFQIVYCKYGNRKIYYVKEILPLEMKHSKVNKYGKIQGEIDKYGDYYANVKYGDLKEIWDEIHKGKNCTTID